MSPLTERNPNVPQAGLGDGYARSIRIRSESLPDGVEFDLAAPEDLGYRDKVRLHMAAERLEKILTKEIPWLDKQIDWLLPHALPTANEDILSSMSRPQQFAVVHEFLYGKVD